MERYAKGKTQLKQETSEKAHKHMVILVTTSSSLITYHFPLSSSLNTFKPDAIIPQTDTNTALSLA